MSTQGYGMVTAMPMYVNTGGTNDMSSQGSAAVLLLPFGLAVGAGILVAEGIMWCGRKMQENYLSACESYTNLAQEASKQQRAHKENRQFVLAAMIEQFTVDINLSLASGSSRDSSVEGALAAALDRARFALNTDEQAKRMRADCEQKSLRHQLQSEILSSKDFLHADQIAEAQAALKGTGDEIHATLAIIRQAWQDITDTQQLRKHQIQQTQLMLADVRKELDTIRALLTQNHNQIDKKRSGDLKAIEEKIQLSERRLDTDAPTALKDAQSAQRDVRNLAHAVTDNLTEAWDKRRLQVAEARGRLDALTQMVNEAITTQVLSVGDGGELAQRITMLTALMTEAETETGAQIQDSLKHVAANVELLKHDIFALVGTGQQQRIGSTIATTLDELGFKADLKTGGAPLVTKVGDSIRIIAKQRGQTPNFGRDEKLVVFYVDRDGQVAYDFSGYVGDTCVHEAERVFSALRAKGIVIIQPFAERQLATGTITPERLQEGQFTPHFDVNKRQAHLHAALLQVLKEEMGFTHVEQKASGGVIEMDAFNGSVGYRYHVELTAQGESKVKRDGIDVSNSPSDQLVAAGKEVAMPEAPNDVDKQEYNFLAASQQDALPS
jgi:hypothetical protein